MHCEMGVARACHNHEATRVRISTDDEGFLGPNTQITQSPVIVITARRALTGGAL